MANVFTTEAWLCHPHRMLLFCKFFVVECAFLQLEIVACSITCFKGFSHGVLNQ